MTTLKGERDFIVDMTVVCQIFFTFAPIKHAIMEEKTFKKLPYGNSNFESIRTENYIYVDKTRYIESKK